MADLQDLENALNTFVVMFSRAFREGWQARSSEKSWRENPYPTPSFEWAAWDFGWSQNELMEINAREEQAND